MMGMGVVAYRTGSVGDGAAKATEGKDHDKGYREMHVWICQDW